ncbi:MAG: hypothetical protein HeimC2_27460, partial [Candidatus Heimdallarchaeota archaeon LC_2]
MVISQASNNQVNEINLSGANTNINVYDIYKHDRDDDGFEDTVDLSIELYQSGFNGNMSGLYVDVYDANAFPYEYLETILVENNTYWDSGYYYFYPSYSSDIQGTLFFNVTAQVDGVDVDTNTFYVYSMHEYMVPHLTFSSLTWITYDNDGIDAFDDTLRVEVGFSTANITGWTYVNLQIYINDTSFGWKFIRNLDRSIYIDSTQRLGNISLEHHITEFGNYRFDLEVYYDETRINSTFFWNDANVDTLPPVSFYAYVDTFTLDTFDSGIDVTFRNYFDSFNVYLDVYHDDGGGYIGTWSSYLEPSGSSTETVRFHGAFPYNGNYTFIFSFYDNFGWYESIEIAKEFKSAYLGSYIGINSHQTFYDGDGDGVADQIEFQNQVQFLNLFGEHYVDMTVFIDDGFSFVEIDYQNYTTFTADGSGTIGFWHWYNPQYSGNYLFVFNVFYDGTSTSYDYYWYGADTAYGNEGISINTYFDAYDQNGDYNADSIIVENYVWYDVFNTVQLDFVFSILLYNEFTGLYENYTALFETRTVTGSGEMTVTFEFFAEVEGEYEFHFDVYLSGRHLEDYSFVEWWYLSSPDADRLNLSVWGDEWDNDNDGWSDNINLIVALDYAFYPGVDIEVFVDVLLNGAQIDNFFGSDYLEGNAYREFNFQYTSEEDGNYQFKVRILRNGEQINELVYYWDDARAYNPDHTPNNSDDSSSTPELPVPAGSMYLFVFALFG